MRVFAHLAVRAIAQHADQAAKELAAARAFPPALFRLNGNADGRKLRAIAVEPAREAPAQGAGIELVGLARAVEGEGRTSSISSGASAAMTSCRVLPNGAVQPFTTRHPGRAFRFARFSCLSPV